MTDHTAYDQTEYLTRAQVAELFHVTPDALATYGALPSVRTSDGRRCYPAGPVLDLARHHHLPIPNPPPATHRHDHDHHHRTSSRPHPGQRTPVKALAPKPAQPNRDHPPPRPGSLSGPQRRALERLATILQVQGHPPWQIAAEIANLAGITRLWAWRLVHGWTREELRARLHQLGATTVDQSMLWRWENGETTPLPQHLDALCRLYQTRPDQLGYGHDYTPPPASHHHDPDSPRVAASSTNSLTAYTNDPP